MSRDEKESEGNVKKNAFRRGFGSGLVPQAGDGTQVDRTGFRDSSWLARFERGDQGRHAGSRVGE